MQSISAFEEQLNTASSIQYSNGIAHIHRVHRNVADNKALWKLIWIQRDSQCRMRGRE